MRKEKDSVDVLQEETRTMVGSKRHTRCYNTGPSFGKFR